ncbi:hypothetical protein CEUSTIGMA_g9070.t1 [Chlamydomonas eustigma]|uniref:Uncharacterized protein n=1 Tax=Chlamydomonas eustigma TaxID=1157962 RepID=A0A250XFG1_9CHLO|nr:hypothetical protein CEUSTIGMA_g9070.t1 [Chlamydomonas eustigma]|eukprot:GAX81642.1 hypothetical protein CEUSTIGMA_g9070.t1 [Chlamydomonas eustigma]
MAFCMQNKSASCARVSRCEKNLGQIPTIHNSPSRPVLKTSQAGSCTASCLNASSDNCGSREPFSRRASVFSLTTSILLEGLCHPSASQASLLGESLKGLLLKAQRQDGGAKMLAPFIVAQQRLRQADSSLEAAAAIASRSVAEGSPSPMIDTLPDLTASLRAVRASSLNCYLFEALPGDDTDTRASLITQQINIADPCTFRLVVKNVVDFSSQDVKAQGSDLVQAAVTSYSKLDGQLLVAMQSHATIEDMQAAREALKETSKAVQDIQDFVAQVLKA